MVYVMSFRFATVIEDSKSSGDVAWQAAAQEGFALAMGLQNEVWKGTPLFLSRLSSYILPLMHPHPQGLVPRYGTPSQTS